MLFQVNHGSADSRARQCVSALLLASLLLFPAQVDGQNEDWLVQTALNATEREWIDDHLSHMDTDEKIGQLLMIRAHSDKGADFEEQVRQTIEKYQVGGILFFQGTAKRQAELTNAYQATAKRVPLWVAMDAEWGLGMRLTSSTISYPRALTLGAISNNELIRKMGNEIGRQCRRLGVHINFAPVLDINNNSNNPVINDRSFGENPDNVTAKGWEYIRGLQGQRVLACGKHFPGHGDTEVDSHYELPVIQHGRQRLNSVELTPFESLCRRGLGSVMVAHLSIPALDPRSNRPATLSEPVVQGILRRQMSYDGLIFTDALEMKGVAKYFPAGEADREAMKAGNDVLLLPENVDSTVKALRSAVDSGEIPISRLDDSVRRILRTKYRLGLNQPQFVSCENLETELHTTEGRSLRNELLRESLVLVRDNQSLIPLASDNQLPIAALAIGSNRSTEFQTALQRFTAVKQFQLARDAENAEWAELIQQLSSIEKVVVSFHGLSRTSKANFGISPADVRKLRRLSISKKVVVVHFGNPYALANFDDLPTLVQAFEESPEAQSLAAEALFGHLAMTGSLPVTASAQAAYGQGIRTQAIR